MYEFVTHMWAPVLGTCEHECSYCYMRNRRFELGPIRINEKAMRNRLGEGNIIFVCHTADLFANNVPAEWINRVLARCCEFSKNRYLFQSKNPARIIDFANKLPDDVFIGTTIETNREEYYESKAPSYMERAKALGKLSEMGFDTMVTIEPIFDFDLNELVEIVMTANPRWVNIGADSKGHKLPEPSKEKVTELIETLKEKTKIELKNNLDRIIGQMK